MKRFFVGIILAACLFICSQPVSAHVLVTDDTKTKGAILHIIPDDDPAAGEEATFYFDTQDNLLDANSSVKLTVKNTTGTIQAVDTKIDGSLVTAQYIFPTQGVYELTFIATSNDKKYTFTQSQRVSRGVSVGALNQPTHTWAEVMLLTSGIGFMLLLIFAFNKRKDIAKRSTF
jgi:hypothetical protein